MDNSNASPSVEISELGGGLRTRTTKRAPAPPKCRGARFDPKGLRVLIVDDDMASAKLASIMLRTEGCDTRIVASAEEAFAILPSFRPRLIVLDLVLPLMGGLLFAHSLKSEPATRDIAIVAVTAFNGDGAAHMAKDAGCFLYIQKPIDPLSFADVLINAEDDS